MKPLSVVVASLCLLFTLLPIAALTAEQPPAPVILDTDIGTWVDDAFALGLALASPELDLRAVTTVGGSSQDRAWLVCRFLTELDRTEVPVAWGRPPQPDFQLDWQIQYRRHPAVVWNRTCKPAEEPAVDAIFQQLGKQQWEPANAKITILAIGPLTNIARLLDKHPQSRPWIGRIVWLGGRLRKADEKPQDAEWNLQQDVEAARAVLGSGVPMTIVPTSATQSLRLSPKMLRRLLGAHRPLAFQIHSLLELTDHPDLVLHDPLAVALAIDDRFCTLEPVQVAIDRDGRLVRSKDGTEVQVASGTRGEAFLNWYVERISRFGKPALPDPPGNRSKVLPNDGMPNRVHAFEDYETDIEKRWWMCGKLETDDVPPGSRRAARAVLTQDFDARMGNTETMYRAVIFNPVPGPPMGQRPRLQFRYKLRGTDTLRVQLFSLSRGYHRSLSVRGLPQDRWTTATVDMRQMRRPDGSGGPLAADERIDDIQFYIDPRAGLLIDDIVLYDAAAEPADAAFPAKILYTGWFDTGKQGREWPGNFEIVEHQPPRTWDAARRVVHPDSGRSWIRLDFRGRRPAAETVRVRFRYHLTGGDQLQLILRDTKQEQRAETQLEGLTRGKWSQAQAEFRLPMKDKLPAADELQILAGEGDRLEIDDVLVYVPSQ